MTDTIDTLEVFTERGRFGFLAKDGDSSMKISPCALILNSLGLEDDISEGDNTNFT